MNELKLVVNNKPQWDAMLEEINSRIKFAHVQLEQFDDLVEVYRIQGELRALRSLTKLRDNINGG